MTKSSTLHRTLVRFWVPLLLALIFYFANSAATDAFPGKEVKTAGNGNLAKTGLENHDEQEKLKKPPQLHPHAPPPPRFPHFPLPHIPVPRPTKPRFPPIHLPHFPVPRPTKPRFPPPVPRPTLKKLLSPKLSVKKPPTRFPPIPHFFPVPRPTTPKIVGHFRPRAPRPRPPSFSKIP